MRQARRCAIEARRFAAIRFALWSATAILPGLFADSAAAHGHMIYPPSRAMEQTTGDRKNWPIAGIKAELRREPCIGLKFNRRFTEVAPGPLRLRLLFPDGANHVGFCYAYLFDPLKPGNRVQIGEMMDCARSDHPGPGKKGEDIYGHMDVTIPTELPCDASHCVLQWVWIARHISSTDPQRFEHYDNCADLKIVEARAEKVVAAPAAGASPPATGQAGLAIGRDHVQRMILYAVTGGGLGNEEAILDTKRLIEKLELPKTADTNSKNRALADNAHGIELLRAGRVAESVRAFEAAYEADPANPEIINNLGYVHLRGNDPRAAEPLLRLALVYDPGRTNAWANLGEARAKLGRRSEAVACFALAFRFSENRGVTRQFLGRLADDGDAETAAAARQALELRFIRTDQKP
jgi:Tfp pilus assembly protein PilF